MSLLSPTHVEWHANNSASFQTQVIILLGVGVINKLGIRQNGHHFAEDIFKLIFVNENVCIQISLIFVPTVQLTICQHWFRYWLGDEKAKIHYLNQWWSPTEDIYVIMSQWVNAGPSYPDNPLRWRHNDHAGFSNHQPHGCLLKRLFGRRSK